MMRRLIASLLGLLALCSVASAQCSGVFQPGTFCGNANAIAAPPKPISGSVGNTLTPAITWSGVQSYSAKVYTAATTTPTAGLQIPQGTAPITPVNGDVWTDSTGIFARIAGITYALGGMAGFANPTAVITSSAINGSAITAMRSDAAPKFDLTTPYNWTAPHSWTISSVNQIMGMTFGQDISGSRLEIQKTNSPTNFTNTRASFIAQHTDTKAIGSGQVIPAWEYVLNWTGDGSVISPNTSNSVLSGLWVVATKTGDGSLQNFTCTAQLSAVGAVGYNESGCFQGQMTNTGSSNGNISFNEGYIADGISGGATFPTVMKSNVMRIGKFNSGSHASFLFVSPEGTQAINSLLEKNTTATGTLITGFDLSSFAFTSGVWATVPNNTNLHSKNSAGVGKFLLGVDASDVTNLGLTNTTSTFKLVKSDGSASGFSVDSSGAISASNISTSGHNLPFLDGANTWSAINTNLTAVTISATEGNQLRFLNNGQAWRVNIVSGGSFYITDQTSAQIPFLIQKQPTAQLQIGANYNFLAGRVALTDTTDANGASGGSITTAGGIDAVKKVVAGGISATSISAVTMAISGVIYANRGTTPTAAGAIMYFTDASTNAWGGGFIGGGTNKVLGFYNGTNWTVFGK
jgi:hypothetical protein